MHNSATYKRYYKINKIFLIVSLDIITFYSLIVIVINIRILHINVTNYRMATAFCYYGVVLMTTELFRTSSEQCGSWANGEKIENTCQLECRLRRSDYIDLLWTTLAEFPGIFSTVFAIEKIGRRKTMSCQLVMFSIVICFLGRACLLSRAVLTIGIFLARGLIAGVFQAAYVYTPEVYPTHLRSIGVSACSAMARIGAMITPYIAQVFLQWSITGAMTIYAIAALCAAIATLALPVESKNHHFKESSNNTNK